MSSYIKPYIQWLQYLIIGLALAIACVEESHAQTVVNFLNTNNQPTPVKSSNPLPVTATVSGTFNTSANATASDPTYTPGTQALSQDLSGHLRVGATQSGTWAMSQLGVTNTNVSGTITTGGTFQTAITANASRKSCLIQNSISETTTLYVYFGTLGTATSGNAFEISPGGSISCSSGNLVDTSAVNVMASNTGHVFKGVTQ